MSSLTGVNAAVLDFDASLSELAICTGDGRVRLFNVAQQRLTADITQDLAISGSGPGQAATEVYSCLTWGAKGPSKRHLFLGSLTGVVRCYDAARAEVRWAAADTVDGPIAALAAAADGSGALLVVGKTGGAALLDQATGSVTSRWRAAKNPLSKAAMLPSGAALVAGSSLSLHDASSGARLHKWAGHATPVVALAATPDGAFCCSAAEGERAVAVWSCATTPAGKLTTRSAVGLLNMDAPAVGIAIGAAAKQGGSFYVAAVTRAGALRLFECVPSSDGDSVCVRHWGASSATSGTVLCAAISAADASGVNLMLAFGSSAKPQFQSCRAVAAGNGLSVVQVAAAEEGMLMEGGGGETRKRDAGGGGGVAVIGAEEGVVTAGRGTAVKRAAGAAGLSEKGDKDEDMGAAAGATIGDYEDEDEDEDEDEEEGGVATMTFAERVAAMQGGAGGGAVNNDSKTAVTAAEPPSGPLKADSLAVLLSQALQSNDKALLERCLAVRSEDVINKTVARLSPPDAAAFLRAAVQRLQSAPARGEQLATWIRSVLLHHTAYLTGVGGTQATLGYLYQLIETRLAAYQPLLALSGRLDLVLANARRAAAEAEGLGFEGGLRGPMVRVEVASDGDFEVEDAFDAAGLSDSSDEEDDDEFRSSGSEGEGESMEDGDE